MWIDDQLLADCDKDLSVSVWVPKSPMVVLGRSNKATREVNTENCLKDGIPILKRLGGGGTVLLHKGCLVVSIGTWVKDYYQNDLYFRLLNQSLINTIQRIVPDLTLGQRGYSDIVLGEKKIAGTSLFRSRNYLLYQASILVDLQIESIERYLAHPSAEPDYRRGRSHRDFLLGLLEVTSLQAEEWAKHFFSMCEIEVRKVLKDELISSQNEQSLHVKSRVGEVHSIE